MKSKKSIKDDEAALKPIEYPSSEDIYSKSEKVDEIDTDDLSGIKKTPQLKKETRNELDFTGDQSGDDLDIPGADLDDEDEATGSEDEENNYYSLGGDEHNDLEEDQG